MESEEINNRFNNELQQQINGTLPLYLNEEKMETARQPQTPRGRDSNLHP